MPDFEGVDGVERSGSRASRGVVLILVAAAVVLLAVIGGWWMRPAFRGAPVIAAPSATASASASTTAPGTTATAIEPGRPPACKAGQLVASLGEAGPTAGKQNIIILLHNTSDRSCWLGGLLPLSGVRAGGGVDKLAFEASEDPGYADPGPVTGPGPVAPGGYGAILVTIGLRCEPVGAQYVKLRIQLRPGQVVDMAYPPDFKLGCFGNQAPAGPVPGPTGLLGR